MALKNTLINKHVRDVIKKKKKRGRRVTAIQLFVDTKGTFYTLSCWRSRSVFETKSCLSMKTKIKLKFGQWRQIRGVPLDDEASVFHVLVALLRHWLMELNSSWKLSLVAFPR